jgi:hypothetical protein
VDILVETTLSAIDWDEAKADLAADDFDNGRSPDALRRSFEQSQHVAIVGADGWVIGMARLLSDGVCATHTSSTSGPVPRVAGRVSPARWFAP